MADRDTLMLLEAIRLEIRALSIDVARGYLGEHGKAEHMRKRGDLLVQIGFSNIQLANDEKEALGQ